MRLIDFYTLCFFWVQKADADLKKKSRIKTHIKSFY